MIDFFKPEDFIIEGATGLSHSIFTMAQYANAKLEREGKVVYGQLFGSTFVVPDSKLGLRSGTSMPDTHTALLINIKPIVKCEHKGEITYPHGTDYSFRCECGARVKPSGFEEVK